MDNETYQKQHLGKVKIYASENVRISPETLIFQCFWNEQDFIFFSMMISLLLIFFFTALKNKHHFQGSK